MAATRPIAVSKSRIDELIDEDQQLTHLFLAYSATAAFWLILGTLTGLYLALRFLVPDFGIASWLSFGRLRPVHTNVLFWGWTSLAMLGLAIYVVPRTSQRQLFSIPLGWTSLLLINAAVAMGTFLLMDGVNNGGQEYREFIWPVMGLFAVGVLIMTYNLYQTVARRNTREIYISNWYILAAFFLDAGTGYHCLPALVSKGPFRDSDSGILHAHGCRNVVHTYGSRFDVLFSSKTSEQAHLLLFAGSSGFLDSDGILFANRRSSLCVQPCALVAANRCHRI